MLTHMYDARPAPGPHPAGDAGLFLGVAECVPPDARSVPWEEGSGGEGTVAPGKILVICKLKRAILAHFLLRRISQRLYFIG